MESAAWDVVVIGGASTDYTGRGPELPGPGASVEGDAYREGPGGKGANQAVAAVRLGARVALVGQVGNDARGETLLGLLAADGVDTRHVERDPEEPTGAALITVGASGEKQTLGVPGANRRLRAAAVGAAACTIARTRVVLVSLEVPLAAVEAAICLGRDAGARVVLDPAPSLHATRLPDDLLRHVDVIKPNATEAEALTGLRPRDRTTARAAAERLFARGVGAVAVQAGGGDNLLAWRDGEQWLPALPVDSVDETGAGDALAAALAVALAEGRPLTEAGPFASAAAALATTALGAQTALPCRSAVLGLLARGCCHGRRCGTSDDVSREIPA